MNEMQILASLQIVNRGIYQSKLCAAQKQERSVIENSVKILNYDSITGNYNVKNTAGQIFSSRPISNGIFAIGDQVSLVAPIGGTTIIDAMPR
jgi:hypothetical protein